LEEIERIITQIRERWPKVRVLLRGDSGFAREVLMRWCEQNRVDYVFGLARNERLTAEIQPQLTNAAHKSRRSAPASKSP
jgi:hypothetical protein